MHPTFKKAVQFHKKGDLINANKILADILKINVEKPKVTETTALGAAMMAAYTDGKFSSLEELSKLWSSDKTFKSKMNDNDRSVLLGKWDYYVSKTLT